MTGALKRWEKRPKAWTETWQCLHHEGPTRLAGGAGARGRRRPSRSRRSGRTAPRYDDASGRAGAAAVLAEHGWDRDLPSFRPFLAYAELATMFDTLSSLYDALTPVLGLADIDELAASSATTRLRLRQPAQGGRRAPATRCVARARPRRRARRARRRRARRPQAGPRRDSPQLLRDAPDYSGDTATLRRLAGLALPTDEEIRDAFKALRVAERAHEDAAKTDAARATNIAALLRRALAVRDPERLTDDCPVCGTPDVLDDAWARQAAEQAAALDEQATALTTARARARRRPPPRRRPAGRQRPRRPRPRAPVGLAARRRPRRAR